MTVLAQITDVHLPPLPLPRPTELCYKQLLGFLNWHWSRKKIHRSLALELLLNDLEAQSFDHLIVSGDLLNIALKAEVKAGRAFLERLEALPQFNRSAEIEGQPVRHVSFVPGNHDYYSGDALFEIEGTYADYMTSDIVGASLGGGEGPVAPYVRKVNNVALIGMNSAVPTPPFKAYGEVSRDQLIQMGKILKKAKSHGFYRCVVIHHPPLPELAPLERGLLNAPLFVDILREAGAELVLYGHNHRQAYNRIVTVDGPCHVVGTPSASAANAERYDLARYNLFEIEKTKLGWKTSIFGRRLDHQLDRIVRAEKREL